MADIAGLRSKLGQAEANAAEKQAEYDRLRAAANSSNFAKDANGQIIDVEGIRSARAAATNYRTSVLEPAQAEASDAALALQNAERTVDAPDGKVSSGQVVAEQQNARAEGSISQNPPDSPFQQSSTGLNVLPEDELEFGTNGRIRPLSETQATPPVPPQPFASPGNQDAGQAAFVTTKAGVGAASEDSSNRTTASVQQIINANFSQRIDPRPNILDNFVSYTYSLTWYLLTPAQFNTMSLQQKKNLSGWQILMQSAGAPITPGNGTPGRNQFFTSDYYIDNLIIDQALAGKGTGAAQNSMELQFTVTEPNGFTLVENLYRAVSTYYKQNNVNANRAVYLNAQYVMCIRFYGYNESGELVRVGKSTNPGGGTPDVTISTDVNAVVEKFLPFIITQIDTRLVSRQVEYQIKGIGIPYVTAFGSQRGSIPFDYELVGTTVGEVLNGRPVGTKYTRTEGRTNTGQPPSVNPTAPLDPGPTGASVNDTRVNAGVDQFGSFTGETANPFAAGA